MPHWRGTSFIHAVGLYTGYDNPAIFRIIIITLVCVIFSDFRPQDIKRNSE